LAKVDAIRADGQRDIDAVIDDEERTGVGGPSAENLGERDEIAIVESFLSELDKAHTGFENALEHIERGTARAELFCDDDVEIGGAESLGAIHSVQYSTFPNPDE
jgi:hypothetical protein